MDESLRVNFIAFGIDGDISRCSQVPWNQVENRIILSDTSSICKVNYRLGYLLSKSNLFHFSRQATKRFEGAFLRLETPKRAGQILYYTKSIKAIGLDSSGAECISPSKALVR